MNCENAAEVIPGLIRREIQTEERIEAIEHIRACEKCRSEYLSQLNIFYSIDKNLVLNSKTIDPAQFRTALGPALQKDQKMPSVHYKYYLAIAASLILISLVLWNIMPSDEGLNFTEKLKPGSVIQNALENEDWPYLQKILDSGEELNRHADEQIPLKLLIDKLQRLEKAGIGTISFTELFEEAQQHSAQYQQNQLAGSGMNKISIDFLIKTLERVSPYTSQASLKDISTYIEKNQPKGTDS